LKILNSLREGRDIRLILFILSDALSVFAFDLDAFSIIMGDVVWLLGY